MGYIAEEDTESNGAILSERIVKVVTMARMTGEIHPWISRNGTGWVVNTRD
jgi:hypothetical protein